MSRVQDMMSRFLRKPVEVDEMTLARAADRAARAEALLRDDMLMEAFAVVENHYCNAWRTTDANDIETRERAWVAVQLVDDLRNHLLAVVRDGKVASAQIERLQRAGRE